MGFAYSPQWGGFLTGHGKTTFRGGYRLLYDPPFYNIYLNMASSAPQVLTAVLYCGTVGHQASAGSSNGTECPFSFIASSLAKGVFDPR